MTFARIGIRVAQAVAAVIGVTLIGFVMVHSAPGDPVFALAGEYGDESYYDFIRERFELDRSLPVRLVTYARRVMTGDFGTSYVLGRPVLSIIGERVPATLLLTVSALFVSSMTGLVLGVFAGIRPFSTRDVGVTSLTLALYAAPVFWLGQLAILFVAFRVSWFPIQGMTSAGIQTEGAAMALDIAKHLVLPTLVLASQQLVAVSRLTRTGVIDQLAQPHVRTARAKGLTNQIVVVRHALRLALLPVVTLIGHRVGHLVSGAILVEIVFGWPGIGQLTLDAIRTRDMPILLGLFMVMAFTVVIANLLTDLIYEPLDARIKYRSA